jgi:threonine dehydrogenase-like Zn-dependent dehydrogenase
VAKAWEQVERISARACLPLETVLITGAGPIGLLAALMATQRGHDVHVLDRVTDGPKPALVEALGSRYHSTSVAEAGGEAGADIIVECTGVPEVVVDAMQHSAAGAIVCLTGVSRTGRTLTIDTGSLNNELVLENDVVFGTVSANRRHFEAAAATLARSERGWLEALITRRVPLERWPEALDRRPHDVKTVIQFSD